MPSTVQLTQWFATYPRGVPPWHHYSTDSCCVHVVLLWHCSQILYFDGQFNDARYNVTLALTAAMHGCTALNHAEVKNLIKVWCGRRAVYVAI